MTLRTPPLAAAHADAGAKLTEFGGWEMPVEFDSIRQEHEAVRNRAGKFDVSHMGEIEVSGPDAERLMNRLTTNDVSELEPGDAQYSTVTNDAGDIIDDTIVYRLPEDGPSGAPGVVSDGGDEIDDHDGTGDGDETGGTASAGGDETGQRGGADYLFVPNAGGDGRLYDRWVDHADRWDLDVAVENVTEDYGMIALQGPHALRLLSEHCRAPGRISRFSAAYREVAGATCLVARTGYTGEDGVELLFKADDAEAVWSALECQPCGLGARDTLRLEAGLLLSGQDFDVEENPRNPYEARIGFVVKLDTEFVGRDALERVKEEGVEERLVGFRLLDRGVPRHGYDIVVDGDVVGTVTSGTMSPTLGEAIGLGYVPVAYADPDTGVRVDIRDDEKRAVVESLPFYERE